MLYIIDSCFGCGSIYIHHAVHYCIVVMSCPSSSVSLLWMTCGSTHRCHFPTRPSLASKQCCETYIVIITQLGNVVSHGYSQSHYTIAGKILFFPPRWSLKKKISIFCTTVGTTANIFMVVYTYQCTACLTLCNMLLLQHAACSMTHEHHCSLCMQSARVLQITHYHRYRG